MSRAAELIKGFCEKNNLEYKNDYSDKYKKDKVCVGIICDNPNDTITNLQYYFAEKGVCILDTFKLSSMFKWEIFDTKYILYFPDIQE